MRQRPFLILALVAVLGAAAFGVSASSAATTTPNLSNVTLNFGQISGLANTALLKFANLDNTPYKVSYSSFTAAPPVLTAIGSGSVDLSLISLTATIEAQASGIGLSAVAEEEEAKPSFRIIASKSSGISSLADLKGQTIAVYRGTAAEGLLIDALQSVGLTESDVTLVNLPPAGALSAFTGGQVDAWSTWEPYASEAIVSYGAVPLTVPGSAIWNSGYVVASKSALADPAKSAAISDYIQRLVKAATYARAHPIGWQAAYATATGLSPELASLISGSITYSIAPLSPLKVNTPYRDAIQTLLGAGMIASAPTDPESVFDHRYDKVLKALEKTLAT